MKKIMIFMVASIILLLSACQPINETAVPTEPVENIPTEEPIVPPTETPETEPPEETTQEPAQQPADFEAAVRLEEVAAGMTAPVDLDAPDDGTDRLFVTDQIGLIRVIDSDSNLLETPLLDLREQLVNINSNYDERGLLGMAIHPDFAENGRFFVYYSSALRAEGPQGWDHTSILSEFTISNENPNIADLTSESVIMEIDQPQGNHNSGAIAFGPDGYLYIPLGDGGGANDTGTGHAADWYEANVGGNGQDNEGNMHGSILRIDIDNGDPYAIPDDNPEISKTHPEIWAFGFRNPYRMAFDPGGENELFVGDAGQNLWEEVSIVEAGGNYGWNVREGAHCFSSDQPRSPVAITDCPTEDPLGNPLIDPIIEFRNSNHPDGGLGTSVVGGVVYRGGSLPTWDGRYIFGQWSTGFATPDGDIFVATRPEEGMWDFEIVQIAGRDKNELGEYVLGFGQDTHGEVYVLTSQSAGPSGSTGSVYRFVPPEELTSGEEDQGPAEEITIIMQNNTYQRSEITIPAGTTVTWENEDSYVHNVISGTRGDPTGMIESPDIQGGGTFSYIFEEPGTYEYYCAYHPGMSATITVTE